MKASFFVLHYFTVWYAACRVRLALFPCFPCPVRRVGQSILCTPVPVDARAACRAGLALFPCFPCPVRRAAQSIFCTPVPVDAWAARCTGLALLLCFPAPCSGLPKASFARQCPWMRGLLAVRGLRLLSSPAGKDSPESAGQRGKNRTPSSAAGSPMPSPDAPMRSARRFSKPRAAPAAARCGHRTRAPLP